MGLVETVEIRERHCGFPPFPQARERSPRAKGDEARLDGTPKKMVHPDPNPVFRHLRKAESGGGKQDAIDDYSGTSTRRHGRVSLLTNGAASQHGPPRPWVVTEYRGIERTRTVIQ